jgi:lysophospholipase L1-like esterase
MRVRLLALVSAVALFVVVAAPAHAGTDGTQSQGFSYLALGDSVPFGFSPLLNAADADNFLGYPEVVADRLHLQDVNATCPGEATGGFLSLTGTDNVCRFNRFVLNEPLHVSYTGTQMDFALAYLHSHQKTRLVTLTLGANDLFRWQKDCAVSPTTGTCPLGFFGVLGVMQANLNTIFSEIRGAGYKGLIVAVTYYALDYRDTSIGVLLNAQMIAAATSHGAFVASGLEAWRATATAAGGSSCVAGLLIRTSPTACDVHPTPLGRDLLAGAVIDTLATTCPANSAAVCIDKDND